jgi:hypothetical protein
MVRVAAEVVDVVVKTGVDAEAGNDVLGKAAPTFIETMKFTGPILFDIETAPLPDDQLRAIYTEPTFEEFAESCDKRWKPETVAAKYAESLVNGFENFRSKAALDARTCRVLTVAYLDAATGRKVLDDGDGSEAELLTTFWEMFAYCKKACVCIIGFNSNSFDVPVLARRAMKYRIPLPIFRNGRYLDRILVDLREYWGCGEYQAKGDLDSLSRFFGGPGKNGSGADFHKLWNGTDEEHNQAVEYALNDLDMTLAVARGVQVI